MSSLPVAGGGHLSLASSFWLERVMYFGIIASLLAWSLWSPANTLRPFQSAARTHKTSKPSKPVEFINLPDPRIGKSITNWDSTRRQWLARHPTLNRLKGRIIMITGSQPSPCSSPVGDHYLLRLFKNKVDYCRIHGACEIFYNNAILQPEMPGYWAKYPIIRAAMIAHPEAEWIWWVDSDAAITDMQFKPLLKSRYARYNLVVQGWSSLIYGEHKSWYGANAGVFFLRNCQWSMDLIDKWSSMGPISPDYRNWGSRQKSVFPDKKFPESDDQTGLLYLLVTEKEKWADKVYIDENVDDFQRNSGPVVADLKNKTLTAKWYKGLGRRQPENLRGKDTTRTVGSQKSYRRRPFITHFPGCQPCRSEPRENSCLEGMEMVLNFADDQVLLNYGYVHPDLRFSSSIKPLPGL